MRGIIDHTPAFALVGEFMFVWAHLEGEMVQTIRRLAGIESAIESAILGANIGARDKLAAVKTLLLFNGPKRNGWDEEVASLCNRIGSRSDDRNTIVHNPFAPGKKGGLKLFLVKAKGKFSIPDIEWDEDTMRGKITQIGELQKELKALTVEADGARYERNQMLRSTDQRGFLGRLMTQPRSDYGSHLSTPTSDARSDLEG